jgi:hypothetical protein
MDAPSSTRSPQEAALLAHLAGTTPGHDIQLERTADGTQLVRETTPIARRWVRTIAIAADGSAVTTARPATP